MSEMSDTFKLVNAMKLAKTAQVGMELTYFDVIELLGELDSLKSYIAELEKDNDEFRQLIRDWSIVLEQDGYFQLWQVESVRQAMLEINKESEK